MNSSIAAEPPQLVETFLSLIETEDVTTACDTEGLPQMVIHTLMAWALEGKNQGQGRGFPFDQPYMIFYQRLVTAYTLLGQFSQSGLFKTAKEKKLYSTIRRDLQPVIRDSVLKRASDKMQEKVDIFIRLRSAMRITLPDSGEQARFE